MIDLFMLAALDRQKSNLTTLSCQIDKDLKKQIVQIYYDWVSKSRTHDIFSMLRLVVPSSDFEKMTIKCKDSWESGKELYYSFNSVEVEYTEKNPSDAIIYGNWELYQGQSVSICKGGFYSSAKPIDGKYYGNKWKLNDMTSNLNENWWKE